MKQDLKSMTLEEMQAAFKALGEPAFRKAGLCVAPPWCGVL